MARPSGNGVAGPLPGLLGLLLGAVLPLALGLGLLPLPASRPWPSGQCAGDRRTLPGAGDRTPPPRPAYRTSTGIRKPLDNRGFDFVVQLLPVVVKPPLHSGHPLSHIVTGSGLPNDTRLGSSIPLAYAPIPGSIRPAFPSRPPSASIATLQPPPPASSTSRPE